ncbi:MAG: SDR family NAD(P)-dependent oxidoreductase [Deltaproteobacteria bacterium]
MTNHAKSLIIGASGGIGAALVAVLTASSTNVTSLSRSLNGLDLTDEASITRILGTLDPPYDTIIVATGALELDGIGPEKSLRTLAPETLAKQFALNAIGPALILKHALRLLPRDRPARVGILSARVGSISDNHLGGWYSYRAAKAALNQLIHTAAIEIARTHPEAVIALLHPGTVETNLTAKYAGSHPTVTPHDAAKNLLNVLDTLKPAQTGQFFDWQGERIPF